ncbi:unnamed protein product [Caenorhabditis angaria]|uniref:F-box domain-containing protein n=1 Tax=Caenorhabditis angaria TaxID=860376 RepID=A0A9P1IBV2_9PELO|nr:unnamed protein product [Caenorhabditis angaria]
MEINVTDDSLELISSYLSPVSRLNLAALNEQFYYACTVWRDVKTIVFDIDDITLAAPNMVHKYVYSSIDRMTSIRTALKMCPGIKRLIIQAKLKESDISVLNENPSLISKLYISTENLGLQDFPVFKRLRTLHIVANSMKEYRVMNTIGPKILQSAFPMCLRRICLTDVYLTSNLIEYLSTLPNLTYLDLIGCLVDTNVAPKYIESLEKCQSLEELSLPPSFFSFTTSNRKLDADKKISFKKT